MTINKLELTTVNRGLELFKRIICQYSFLDFQLFINFRFNLKKGCLQTVKIFVFFKLFP